MFYCRENLHALSKAIKTYKDPEAVSCPEYPSYEDALEEIGRLAKDKRILYEFYAELSAGI